MNGHGNSRGVGYSATADTTQDAMANMNLQQNNSVGQHSSQAQQSTTTNRMPPPPPMPGRAIPSQQQSYQQPVAPPQPVR